MPDPAQPAPRASVLIPVYNSAPTLARCILSAAAQTLPDIEILIADDASSDASAAIAENLAAHDTRIRVLRLPRNGGKPRAMNLMVAQARGQWIAVLDADDAFAPDRLRHLIAAAEVAGTDMAADNLLYVDSGRPCAEGPAAGFGTIIRAAFDPARQPRHLTKADLVATADSFADFDYGVLKPVIRAAFIAAHGLRYDETSRLAEDFTYLMRYFVAGGSALLLPDPLYLWTMPFGTLSRAWTQTGAGAWRYDYRQALAASAGLIEEMQAQGEADIVAMLRRRARQYRAMIPYIDAQKQAASGHFGIAAVTLARHPLTWRLLAQRVGGRALRAATRLAGRKAVVA